MAEHPESNATALLIDEIRLWQVLPADSAGGMITAACDALVAGVDSPATRLLAGARTSDDAWELHDLANATVAELTSSEPADTDEIQRAALRAGARRLLDGHWSRRRLTSWAHIATGHEGVEEGWTLCELDDEYDLVGAFRITETSVDVQVDAEARRFLGLEPEDAKGAATPGGAAPSRRGLLRLFRRSR